MPCKSDEIIFKVLNGLQAYTLPWMSPQEKKLRKQTLIPRTRQDVDLRRQHFSV